MTHILKPDSAEGVEEAVKWAAAEQTPLEVVGSGTKRGIGRPVQAEYTLDVSGLSGITLYEPDELVMSARAGTPIVEVETLLAENDQELAFEPPNFAGFYGLNNGAGTIGGVWATNLSGPRRIKAGAARDHMLGIAAVSGRGEAFKSGGRVVKNVTGYDLSRGLAGSWGTLAVLTDVTFKILPRAETSLTLLLSGLNDGDAISLLCRAMGSDCEVSGAAHLPGDCTGWLGDIAPGSGDRSLTAFRLEGFADSVKYRADRLAGILAGQGDIRHVADISSRDFWRGVRDISAFHEIQGPVWKISVPPTAGPSVVESLKSEMGPQSRACYDWSGGLVWLACAEATETQDAHAALIRQVIAACGGHATLVRGSPSLRNAVPTFEPQEPNLAALTSRLKESFDPHNILNPGRMGIGS